MIDNPTASGDVFQLVEAQADLSQFNEYLVARRRSLLAQAKALEQQRSGLMIEVSFIEKVTGPKIVRRQESD